MAPLRRRRSLGDPRPRVSVLLPAHNAGPTLQACLRSIQRQSEPGWECIVVDDGSTDATRDLVTGFAARDPRFRLVVRPHRGLVPTLSAGLERCTGRYVARMDADDLMHRERLREQVALLDAHEELAAAGCHVRIFPRGTLTDGSRRYESWLNAIDSPERVEREAFVECPVAHPSLIARRDVLARQGYRDSGWPEDYDLVLRMLARGDRIGMLTRRRLGWRNHPRRLSRTAGTYCLDRFTECKAAHLARTVLADCELYDLWGYGSTGRALRRELDRLGKRPRQVVEVHPRRIGQRIHGAAVIPPERLGHPARIPLLVSVAGVEPRTRIRRFLEARGYRETRDFICTA